MISLDDMSDLARKLMDAEQETAKAEAVLSRVKERERLLREETIPSAMQELGLESLKLDTGQKLSCKMDVFASITEEKKDAAFDWLQEHGFGGLVKVVVSVAYGKGDAEKAAELVLELQKLELPVECDQDIHVQTLKAFLREQLSKGSEVDLDLFSARPVWKAKLSNK